MISLLVFIGQETAFCPPCVRASQIQMTRQNPLYIDEENDFCSSVTWILAYYTLLYHAHVSETKDQVDVCMIVAEFELDGPR